MMEKCFDIGTIQAFLDGELASEMIDMVARHTAVCDNCAIMLADAEDETALAFSALDQELNALVPTQRLWTKINDSIEKERKPFWKPIFAFFLQPSTVAFGSLLFVAVVSITLLSLKPETANNYTAQNNPVKSNAVVNQPSPINQPALIVETFENPVEQKTVAAVNKVARKTETHPAKVNYAAYVKPENVTAPVKLPAKDAVDVVNPILNENVLGEESYVKTIATLTATVKNNKDQVLNPSVRFAFERDLAVTDDAIKQMKKEVSRNPKNEAARQILRASYQNKIDLLNSVAEKTELMASLK